MGRAAFGGQRGGGSSAFSRRTDSLIGRQVKLQRGRHKGIIANVRAVERDELTVLLQTKSEVVKISKCDVQVLESGREYARAVGSLSSGTSQMSVSLGRDMSVPSSVAGDLASLAGGASTLGDDGDCPVTPRNLTPVSLSCRLLPSSFRQPHSPAPPSEVAASEDGGIDALIDEDAISLSDLSLALGSGSGMSVSSSTRGGISCMSLASDSQGHVSSMSISTTRDAENAGYRGSGRRLHLGQIRSSSRVPGSSDPPFSSEDGFAPRPADNFPSALTSRHSQHEQEIPSWCLRGVVVRVKEGQHYTKQGAIVSVDSVRGIVALLAGGVLLSLSHQRLRPVGVTSSGQQAIVVDLQHPMYSSLGVALRLLNSEVLMDFAGREERLPLEALALVQGM